MKRHVRVKKGELWWLTTFKGATRNEISAIQKRITRLQGDEGFYKYSALIFETRPKLHAHIAFVGSPDIAAALERSAVCRGCRVELVTDADGLSKGYLVKERTSQAGFGRSDLGGRIQGSPPRVMRHLTHPTCEVQAENPGSASANPLRSRHRCR
jgi:hypothetical protein